MPDILARVRIDSTQFDAGMQRVADLAARAAAATGRAFTTTAVPFGQLTQHAGAASARLSDLSKTAAATGGAMQSLGHMSKEAFSVFAGFTLSTALMQSLEKVKELTKESVKLGYEARLVGHAFEDLAEQAGVNARALIDGLKKASGETINESNVMKAAARALQQGFDPKDIVRLMEVARSKSIMTQQTVEEAFNSMTESIANQQVRALKHMGIIINLEQAVTKYAQATGVASSELNEMGRGQGILQGVLAVTRTKNIDLTVSAVQQKEAVEHLRAAWDEFLEQTGMKIIDVAFKIGGGIKDVVGAMEQLDARIGLSGSLVAVFGGWWAVVRDVFVALKPLLIGVGAVAAVVLASLATGLSVILVPLRALAAGLAAVAERDFANALKRMGDATADQWEKTKASAQVFADYIDTLKDMATGQAPVTKAIGDTAKSLKDVGDAADLGKNKFGALANQLNGTLPDLKGFIGVMSDLGSKLAQAMLGPDLGTDVSRRVEELMEPVRKALKEMAEAPGGRTTAFAAYAKAMEQWAIGAATATVKQEKLNESIKAMADAVPELQQKFALAALGPQLGGDSAKRVEEMLAPMRKALKEMSDAPGGTEPAFAALAETMLRYATDVATATVAQEDLNTSLKATYEDLIRLADESAAWALPVRSGIADVGKELADLTPKLDAERAAFGLLGRDAEIAKLAHQHFTKAVVDLTGHEREFVEGLVDTRAALGSVATAAALAAQGYSALAAEQLAMQAAGINEWQESVRTATTALETINNAERQGGILRSKLAQEQMKAQGNFFGFMGESLRQLAIESADVWKDIDALVRGTAQSMQRSLSDLFFNVLTGQVTSLREMFKSLWQAVVRQITDFLASAAVRQLLQFAASMFGGSVGGGAGAGAGLGTALMSGAVQLAVDRNTGNLVAVGGGGGGSGGFGTGSMIQAGSAGMSLAGSFPGLANIAGNWAAGGLSGALFGLPAGVSFGEGALELGAGIGAFGGSLTEATAGVAGFGGAISSMAGPLAALGIALNIGLAAFGPDPTGPAAIGTYAGTAVGAVAGGIIGSFFTPVGTVVGALIGGALGGSAGGFLGGLFGGAPRLTHAQREQRETSRVLGAASAGQGDILSARSYRELYDKLITYSSGYVGGTSSVALSPHFTNTEGGFSPAVFRDMAERGLIQLPPSYTSLDDFFARNPWSGAGGDRGPTAGLPLGPGRQNPDYPVVTYEGFREIARLHPDWLEFGIQAGVTPGNLTGGNTALAESTQALMKQLRDIQDKIDAIVVDLFKEITELDTDIDPTVSAIEAFKVGLEEVTTAAQKNLNEQRIAMLDMTDPQEILTQTAKIRDLIHQRYDGEIELIKNFTANIQKAADGWRKIGESVRAQVDAMRLGPFGPTNPSLALTQTQTAFDAALAAFRSDQSLETADAVAKAIDPLLTAASAMFARPSTEFRSIFDQTATALDEIAGYADEQAATLEDVIAQVIGEGNTIEQLTADNTAAMREELVALRQDVLHMLGEIGYGDAAALSTLTQSLLDAGTPAAIAQTQQLSEAQRQTILLAVIAQNTMSMGTGTGSVDTRPRDQTWMQITGGGGDAPGPGPGGGGDAGDGAGGGGPGGDGGNYQHGTVYVPRTGPSYLHQGEMVLPAEQAAAVRAGGGLGGSVTLSIGSITVSGAGDPRATADEIVDTIERRLREPGRLRTAVRTVARSA